MNKIYLLGILTTIFLLSSCTNIAAQWRKSGGMRITVEAWNVPLQHVLNSIERQTGFVFQYNHKDVDVNRLITVKLSNKTVNRVMRALFSGQGLIWSYEADSIISIRKKTGKQEEDVEPESDLKEVPTGATPFLQLSGRVVDVSGKAIADANVILKGQQKGAATNGQGDFNLTDVPDNATLCISCIGYETKEVKVALAQTPLRITLNDFQSEIAMQEVVSNGYQRMPRERITSAITVIDQKKFNETAGTDVFKRLPYMAASLTTYPPNLKIQGSGMMVRGLSTFGGFREPLIVLDDFPYYDDPDNINPNDVESISILKDAAATSIWGARAGNGVIVITTKRGKYKQPVSVTFNTNVSITPKPDLFRIKAMPASDLIDVETELFKDGFYDSRIPYPAYASLTPAVSILLREREGLVSSPEAAAQLNRLRRMDVRNEFGKYFYRNAVDQQYAINISGGTERHAWFVSGGFDNNRSELDEQYKRHNLRFSNSYKMTRKLEFTANISFTQSHRQNGAPAFDDFRPDQLPIYSQLKNESGEPVPLYTYNSYREGFIDTLGAGKLLDWRYYPMEDYKHTIRRTDLQEVNTEVGVKYTLIKGLSLSTKYRYLSQKIENDLHQDIQSYYTRNIINSFSRIDYARNTVERIVPLGGILDILNNNKVSRDLKVQADLNKGFGDHYLAAIAGGHVSEVVTRDNSLRHYGYDESIYSNVAVDMTNKYPHLITGYEELIPGTPMLNKTNIRFISTYTNASYTFKNKYSISVSGRRDATNTFGIKTIDKWEPLWSSGFSWVISGERFNPPLLEYLRLRLTYGKSGGVDTRKVGMTTIRYEGRNEALNTPYARIDNSYDPQLRWEEVNMLNAGIDFSIKKRFWGSIDLYKKRMTDLYGESKVDVTTGLGRDLVSRNIGRMSGKGMDLELNSININGRISWNSNLIVNVNTDKVVQVKDKEKWTAQDLVGGDVAGREGKPVFAYFAYKYGGLDHENGDPQGYVNGKLSKDYSSILGSGTKPEDLKFVGRMIPAVSGSMGHSLSWKGLTLTARITYKLGYYFRRKSINYETLSYLLVGHADYSKRWQKPGDELNTNIPSMRFDVPGRDQFYALSEAMAVKGDHVRLQYIDLLYEPDSSLFPRSPLKKIQFYLFLDNVGILWKANKENIDPDYQLMGASPRATLGARINF